jgi:putative protein-disulfide isomerase
MRLIFLTTLIMFLSINQKALGQKDTLIYIGDPMCSWCYGFSKELDKVTSDFVDLPLKIVVGGLRAHGTESFGSLSSFLHEHWEDVYKRSGQPFSYDILKSSDLVYNTEPACRAVVAVRAIAPEKEYVFFKALQTSFYFKNENPTDIKTFSNIAASLGIDTNKFEKYFLSPVIINETERDFQLAITMEVQGFPSLLALKDGKIHRISNGYMEAAQIEKRLISLGFVASTDK